MIKRFGNYIKESKGIELHYSAFDWDDNILHMPTVIHMDQKVGDKWLPVDVSTAEFAKVRNDKENYRLRNDDPTLAFSEFRDSGPRGQKAFLEDTIKALDEGLYAPSWDAFIKSLSEGSIFAIITARGHEPESIREGVEYIIDNILNEDQKFLMYSHCLKNAYLFSREDIDSFERLPEGQITKTPLIKLYLDSCDYYGVSSQSFANEFGSSSASNPEKAKELALDKFVEKCNEFGSKVGAKSVSIGFSDDDPKNVEHVQKFFKEKSALSHELGHEMKLNVYKTTDRTIKGGKRSKFKSGEMTMETSNQAWGLEGSVVPFSKWTSDTQWHNPNTKDVPTDDYHNKLKNQVGLAKDLYKEFAYKRNKKTKK
jgi:hypothetical protein